MCLLPVSSNVVTDCYQGAVLMSLAIGGFNCGLVANANSVSGVIPERHGS